MSEVLEALETLRENIRSDDGQIWRQGIRDNDRTREALTVLMDFASAALERPSTAEPVAWCWEHLGMHVTTDRERARQMIADGVDLQPLYTAPPSTAEAQARALDDYAVFVESGEEWNQLSVWLPLCDAQNYLRSVGEHFPFACIFKRIREEG